MDVYSRGLADLFTRPFTFGKVQAGQAGTGVVQIRAIVGLKQPGTIPGRIIQEVKAGNKKAGFQS